jgi:hypothetical protein
MATPNSNITFLGVGNMGTAAIQALLRASHNVTIWNRTKARPQVESAIAAGAIFEADLATALSKNDIIIACFLDYSALTTVISSLEEPSAILKQKLFVNLTNGTPKQAREMEVHLNSLDVSVYLDGAIMSTPQMVGPQQGYVVISGGAGNEAATASLSEPISAVGKLDYLGIDVDAASRFDLAALSPMYGMFAGAFLGMALLKRRDPAVQIGPIVERKIVPMLAPLVPYLGGIAHIWDDKDWENNEGNPVGMVLAGLQNILSGAEDEGVDGTVLAELARLMRLVVTNHGYDAGIAAVGIYMMK